MVFHSFSDVAAPERQLKFLRVISARPDLAQNIKSLNFAEPSYHIELDSVSDTDQQFILDSVVEFGLPRPNDQWADGCDEHHLLLIDLILTRTPNLEALQIPLDYNWDLSVLEHQAKKKEIPPLLPKLAVLDVSHYYISGDCWDVSLSAIDALILAAPALQSISIPSPGYSGGSSKPVPLANLRRLELAQNCHIDPELLASYLGAAPKLEFVALHWDAMSDTYGDSDGRVVEDVWDALELCKESLREVRVDVRDDTEQGGEGERSSLSDFERLEVLRVDGHALGALRGAWRRGNPHAKVDGFLSQLLPRGIREVVFWNLDGGEMMEAMRRLARVVAVGRYPELRSVVLAPGEGSDRYGEEWDGSGWYGVREELEEDFGKGGVTFEIRSERGYWLADCSG